MWVQFNFAECLWKDQTFSSQKLGWALSVSVCDMWMAFVRRRVAVTSFWGVNCHFSTLSLVLGFGGEGGRIPGFSKSLKVSA